MFFLFFFCKSTALSINKSKKTCEKMKLEDFIYSEALTECTKHLSLERVTKQHHPILHLVLHDVRKISWVFFFQIISTSIVNATYRYLQNQQEQIQKNNNEVDNSSTILETSRFDIGIDKTMTLIAWRIFVVLIQKASNILNLIIDDNNSNTVKSNNDMIQNKQDVKTEIISKINSQITSQETTQLNPEMIPINETNTTSQLNTKLNHLNLLSFLAKDQCGLELMHLLIQSQWTNTWPDHMQRTLLHNSTQTLDWIELLLDREISKELPGTKLIIQTAFPEILKNYCKLELWTQIAVEILKTSQKLLESKLIVCLTVDEFILLLEESFDTILNIVQTLQTVPQYQLDLNLIKTGVKDYFNILLNSDSYKSILKNLQDVEPIPPKPSALRRMSQILSMKEVPQTNQQNNMIAKEDHFACCCIQ